MCPRSSASSQASTASDSASNEQAGPVAGKSRSIPGADPNSNATGPMFPDGEISAPSIGAQSSGSICSPAASRASLSARLESVLRRLTSVGSGPSSSEPFAHYDPASSSWKTSQASLALSQSETESGSWDGNLHPSKKSLATWPRSGMTRDGKAFALPTLARHTAASESSSWPTPDAGVFGLSVDLELNEARRERIKATGVNGNGFGNPLAVAVRLFPTPTANDSKQVGGRSQMTRDSLTGSVLWPTPRTSDANGAGLHGTGGADLRTAVADSTSGRRQRGGNQ